MHIERTLPQRPELAHAFAARSMGGQLFGHVDQQKTNLECTDRFCKIIGRHIINGLHKPRMPLSIKLFAACAMKPLRSSSTAW